MTSITVIKPGLLTSIQDIGRRGYGYYAIPISGVMDSVSARRALLLCRLQESDPVIECTMIPPTIKFHGDAQIVLSGADFNWTINSEPVERNKIITVKNEDILSGQKATNGTRGYIAVRGSLITEKTYGSVSTYRNACIGGINGDYLKKGDNLQWKPLPFIDSSKIHVPSADHSTIEIQPGPEFDYLSDLAKFQLLENTYTIHNDSNRMGARLIGEPIDASTYQLSKSKPVLPGFIQLPPSGIPIVLLNDGQTTGGYPRIAYMNRANLDRFNQIAIGESFKFMMNSQ